MLSFERRTASLPGAALFALAAFAVHQLRYFAADGGGAGESLAREGHAYLELAAPVLVTLTGSLVALALLAARAGIIERSRRRRPPPIISFVTFTFLLAAVFTGQELVEGVLSIGHPGGLDAVLGHAGWVALPLAAVFGALLTLLLEALAVVERRVAWSFGGLALRPPAVLGRELQSPAAPLAQRALVFGFARRPPPTPLASVT
jgi:hypothetical protein